MIMDKVYKTVDSPHHEIILYDFHEDKDIQEVYWDIICEGAL